MKTLFGSIITVLSLSIITPFALSSSLPSFSTAGSDSVLSNSIHSKIDFEGDEYLYRENPISLKIGKDARITLSAMLYHCKKAVNYDSKKLIYLIKVSNLDTHMSREFVIIDDEKYLAGPEVLIDSVVSDQLLYNYTADTISEVKNALMRLINPRSDLEHGLNIVSSTVSGVVQPGFEKLDEFKKEVQTFGSKVYSALSNNYPKNKKDADSSFPSHIDYNFLENNSDSEISDQVVSPSVNLPSFTYTRIYDVENTVDQKMQSGETEKTIPIESSIQTVRPMEVKEPKVRTVDDLWQLFFKSEDLNKYLYDSKDEHYAKRLVSNLSIKYLKNLTGALTTFYAIVPRAALNNKGSVIRLRKFTSNEKLNSNAIRQYFKLQDLPKFPVFTHIDKGALSVVNKAYYNHSSYYRSLDPVIVEITGYIVDWSKKLLKDRNRDNPIQDRIDQAFEFEEYFRSRLDDSDALRDELDIDEYLGKNIGSINDSSPVGFRTKGFQNLKNRFGTPDQSDLDFLNFISSSDRFLSYRIAEENE